MSSPHPSDVLLKDPLSKETRLERRNLLATAAIGIVIVKTGLVPSRISALGIEFNQTDQRSLLLAMAAVIIYFFFAFLIYAGSDFISWRLSYRQAWADRIRELVRLENVRVELDEKIEDEVQENVRVSFIWARLHKPMSILRAIFEFGLPILISLYATILLIRARV